MSLLADLTWVSVGRPSPPFALVVPVGSTEQHGPHLPLSTDTDIAVALADAAARPYDDVLVAPAIPYGSSGEHEDFPGTISIGGEAVERLLVELVRSASRTFSHCIFVSTHGGNAQAIKRALAHLQGERRHVLAWSPNWGGDAHAGHIETSIMLALWPERVELRCAERGNEAPIEELMPLLRTRGVRAASANGILGDPMGASAEEGRRLLDAAASELCLLLAGR